MIRKIGIIVGFMLFIIVLAACNKDPLPQDAFKTFIANWEKHDFAKMYDQFSTEVKAEVNEKEFVERFGKIYGDINVRDLSVSFESPKEDFEPNEKGEVTFTYDVSMETIAGPIEFSEKAILVLEEKGERNEWFVKWKPSMFFPDMNEEDEIGLTISKPIRGEIVDRNGVVLAENGLVYEIGMVPQDLGEQKDSVIQEAAKMLQMSPDSIEKKLNASWVQPHFFVPIARLSLSEQELATKVTQLNGVLSQKVNSRVYPFKEAAAHLVGFVGTVTAENLEKLEGKGYGQNDVVGKKGLEMVYEDQLRGEKGASVFIKRADNESKVTLAEKPAIDGETIQLTIDINVQLAAYEQFNGKAGAAAAIHPLTGEALALVSSPSFDPNDYVLSKEKTKIYDEDPLKPLINRFGATYAPGSTFKPITAGIALGNQVITPETTIDVKGKDWQKDNSWGGYHVTRVTDPGQPVNLRDAFVFSDNIYFAQAALEIGGDLFESELTKYGFGEPFPFEYPLYESQISNEGLKKEILLADTGYGQGELQMSPVHLAIAYTPLLNNGNLLKPSLLLDKEDGNYVWKENVVTQENARLIINNLVQVIEDANGTGRDAKIDGLPLAGKTGTAELKASEEEDGQENGLFVAFNTENPQLLVAMIMENVENGSHDVTTKVKAIFEKVLK
ncbi:penicillin-binding transpeptidase domain-containing protein [Fredinandcohnia onubensis]|uniref:penicillin-binding transpeptidase domain-containing protein n=1 Tax=Fredinandcohnia onubensis TaxID=1571209 RepID=UPI001FEC6A74|nr:penicillin-binding transpeptidase domain-containing protein [Fredinandcohnia onubensis]